MPYGAKDVDALLSGPDEKPKPAPAPAAATPKRHTAADVDSLVAEPAAPHLTPQGNTVTDQEVSDFLAGKRSDLPGPLDPARAKSIEQQFVASKPYQDRKNRAERARFDQDQIGTTLAALDAPSLGLAGRIGEQLGIRPREKTQKVINQAAEEHPVAHIAGNFIGPGGAETLGGRLVVGGLQSGLTVAAKASDENTLKKGAEGGAVGTAATLVAEALLRGGGKIAAPILQKIARSQALRALNPLKRDVAMLANQGIESKAADDLLSSGVMRPGANSANIAERVGPELEKRGAAVGASRTAIDDAARGDVVRPGDVADKLEALAGEYAAKPVPEMQSIANDLRGRADLIRAKPHMSLTEAEKNVKQPMDVYAEKMARTQGSPPDKLEALAQARRLVKEGHEEAAQAVDPELAAKFVGSKGDYGRMASIASILERNNPRALANRGLSPSDYGFGIATGQGYQPPTSLPGEEGGEKALNGLYGFLAAQLHKQVRERGNSTMAHLANTGAKAARGLGTGALTAPIQRGAASSDVTDPLDPYFELLDDKERK